MRMIGILTLYRVRNIGACLQATAMAEIIKANGAKPVFIKAYDNNFAFELFKGDTGSFKPWVLPFQIKREIKFRNAFKEYEEILIEDAYKCESVIVGSDSVWIDKYGRMQMPTCFFGDVCVKCINAYAPSVGGNFDNKKYSTSQISALQRFNIVGVRDEETKRFYETYTERYAEIVIDPTLLIDWSDKIERRPSYIPDEDYLLVYGGFTPQITREIEKYGNKHHLRIVNVGIYNRRFKNNIPVSPKEFLNFVKYSKYVITSMFHGVMLSVSLNKQFRYLGMDENRNIKLSTIVSMLGLESCLINNTDFSDMYKWKDIIDYYEVNKKLNIYRGFSIELLRKMIGGIL